MRILITNNSLATRAGTELYVRDIAFALKERGHEPWAYSSWLGEVAEELRAGGIKVLDDLERLDVAPDIIHAHHHLEAMTALLRFPRVPAVYFCHGVRPWEEAALHFPSIRRYVAVDDACRDRLMQEGVPAGRIELLRTFVDLKRFALRKEVRKRPRRALVFSNNSGLGPGLWRLRLGCALAGVFHLDVVGSGAGVSVVRPEEILRDYDVVFAKGRAAHEAAASGAAVMVCDYGRHAGLLTTARYEAWRSLNFGYKLLERRMSPASIARELRSYDAADVRAVALRVREEADLEPFMERLTGLYVELQAERPALEALPEAPFAEAGSAYMRSVARLIKERGLYPRRFKKWVSRLVRFVRMAT